MYKGKDIQERLIKFAARIISVCDALPDSKAGKHLAGQMLRSGTSPAPNYGEARAAESTRDFIHKLKIALKELNETEVWLKIIIESKLLTENKLADVIDVCSQLARILSASVNTAKGKLK